MEWYNPCTLCDIIWNICLNNKFRPKGSIGIFERKFCAWLVNVLLQRVNLHMTIVGQIALQFFCFKGLVFFSIPVGLVPSFSCLLMGCHIQCIIWNIYIVIYWGIFQIFSSQGDITITKVKITQFYFFSFNFKIINIWSRHLLVLINCPICMFYVN